MGFETCHCGRGTVCVCNEHQSTESAPPTTVRGWLETLPEPLKSDVTDREYYAFSEPCNCLEDAIIFQRDIYAQHLPEFAFWWGVWIFVKNGPNQGIRERLKEGYFAAQKAYEPQEKRKKTVLDVINTLPFGSPDLGLGLKSRMASITSHYWDDPAETLLEVTTKIMKGPFIDGDAKMFWEGVHEYFRGYKDGFYSSIAADGYILAQWTMEQANAPAYQAKEVWEQTHFTFEGKTLVDNQLLAMLQEKAAKWDELMETIERLKIC